MYGVLTKLGASAVLSVGLSVLGVSYLCSDSTPTHQQPAAATVGVNADADVNGATAAPRPVHADGGVNGTITVRVQHANPGGTASGPANNPSNPGQPGSNQPGCHCTSSNPSLVTVKPDLNLDVDVDAEATPPGVVVDPSLAVGVVGAVVDGVSSDCGCTPNRQPGLLSVSVGH